MFQKLALPSLTMLLLHVVGKIALFSLVVQQNASLVRAQEFITSQELHEGITDGRFTLVVDVRSQEEWDKGHIAGATLVKDLATTGSLTELSGCETCDLVVYCNSGGRASAAIGRLIAAGFQGTILNGLGVSQYTDAGYTLVNTESVVPYCVTNPGICDAPESTQASADDPKSSTDQTSGVMNASASVFFVVRMSSLLGFAGLAFAISVI